jgi:hypothetical protein
MASNCKLIVSGVLQSDNGKSKSIRCQLNGKPKEN